ncbi:hypothetical protein [Microbacterium sp. HJ5]
MPRSQGAARDLDARAFEYLHSNVNEAIELAYLRAGADPDWERVMRNGEDITDQPETWTPYQRARRQAYVARTEDYRGRGLV